MPIPILVQSGPEIEPIMEWQRLMSRMSGNEERQSGMKLLLEGVKSWRSESAQELSMAPASVMPQHTEKDLVVCHRQNAKGAWKCEL